MSEDEYLALRDEARRGGKSMSETAKSLMAKGRTAGDGVAGGLAEMEERIARTCSRGTKASLASLIAICSVLPHAASAIQVAGGGAINLMRAHGFDVDEGARASDFAALAEWAGADPAEFFDFAWNSAGRIQRHGSAADYRSAVKGVRSPAPARATAPFPGHGGNWAERRFGSEWLESWEDLKRARAELSSIVGSADAGRGYATAAQRIELSKMDGAYRAYVAELEEAAAATVGEPYDSLVFDVEAEGFWRDPTPSESSSARAALADSFGSYGLDVDALGGGGDGIRI